MMATIAAVTVTIVLLGVPLAIFGSILLRDAEVRELDVRATGLSRTVERRIASHEELEEDALEPYIGGESNIRASVLVVMPDGSEVRAGEWIWGRLYPVIQTTKSGAMVVQSICWWTIFMCMARVFGIDVCVFTDVS